MSGTWASGWVTGDVVTAAEYGKSVGAIYDTTLGVAAASIDVSGIIDDYAHLLLILQGRGDTAATTIGAALRFNNDSGANYDRETLDSTDASVSGVASLAQTSVTLGSLPAASATASHAGIVRCQIANYAGTTFFKNALVDSGLRYTAAQRQAIFFQWRSTAAINRITILASSGNFIAGTRLTIYGMGA